MALLMLVTVFVGFAPTYYFAGVFGAHLPSIVIHLHAAAFSCWILLLVTQTSLVSAGRVAVHRRLGVAGFVLACLMVVIGILAATDSLMRGHAPRGLDARTFYIVPMSDMLIFAVFIYFAFRSRSDPSTHKRLIYVATTSLLVAAVARWPLAFVHRRPAVAATFSEIFLLVLVAYDLWSTRKLHRATVWAGALMIFVQQVRIPIGKTPVWHAFASWVQSLAR